MARFVSKKSMIVKKFKNLSVKGGLIAPLIFPGTLVGTANTYKIIVSDQIHQHPQEATLTLLAFRGQIS